MTFCKTIWRLDKISDYLIENETITGKEFMDIFNEVRGITPETDESSEGLSNDNNTESTLDVREPQVQSGGQHSDPSDDNGDFREVRKELPRGAFVNGRWNPDAINPAYIPDPEDETKTTAGDDGDPSSVRVKD